MDKMKVKKVIVAVIGILFVLSSSVYALDLGRTTSTGSKVMPAGESIQTDLSAASDEANVKTLERSWYDPYQRWLGIRRTISPPPPGDEEVYPQ